MGWRDGYIAVDWGTTNRRAYVVDASGQLEAEFEDELGVLSVAPGGFEAVADDIRRRLGERPMLLAGMIGSNRGWTEAPYLPCPAGLADLARSIRWVEPGRVGIVPGISQAGTAGADVMRGEEVQVLGAVAAELVPAESLICHPGTHSKWIRSVEGRIHSFRTMMTGELFGLLKRHSILADRLLGEVEPDADFEAGAKAGLAGEPMLSELFAIRARYLLGEGNGGASRASGLLIGTDVRTGLRLGGGEPIALVGRPDLCALYSAALRLAGEDPTEVDGAAAFLAGVHKLTELI